MARLTGPKHRICRRVGEPVCGSPKCPALKRPYPPGQHGKTPRRRVSEYGRQLLEKQKIKAIYGVSETYLRNTFKKAARHRGRTGEIVLQMLETRLDNLVYRMGFAPTLPGARTGHSRPRHGGRKEGGHCIVLGPTRPSHRDCREGPQLAYRGRHSGSGPPHVPYVDVDVENRSGTLLHVPARENSHQGQ